MKNLSKVIAASSFISCATAQAGGLSLYETSTTDVALASAGMAARAQDASVMAANPAGLANVSGQSFSGHLINLYGDTTLDNNVGGGDAGNIIGYVPLPSAFYSHEVNDKWTVGIGMYGNFGVSLEYKGLLGGIDIPTATEQAVTIQPSASYRINDQWSVGGALGIQYGMFEMDSRIPGLPPINVDDTDIQVNGRVGVLYEMNSGTRLGLAYSSETEFDFNDAIPGLSVIVPQQVVFSAYHELNDKLALMGNLNWQEWSAYKTILDVPTQDTYQIAFGAQYKINKKMTWNAGIAFDSSMYESQSNGDVTVPGGETYRIGTGFDYKINNNHAISVGFEAELVQSSKVLGGLAEFNDPALYFLSIGYNWRN